MLFAIVYYDFSQKFVKYKCEDTESVHTSIIEQIFRSVIMSGANKVYRWKVPRENIDGSEQQVMSKLLKLSMKIA